MMTTQIPIPEKKKRGRPVKEKSSGSEYSEPIESDPGAVALEVEEHQETDDNILAQASRVLQGGTKELSRNQRYKLGRKARDNDFVNLVVTLLTLVLSAWSAPEDIKPNEDEVKAFSVPFTRLLMRHVPMTAKLSQDALDVIGMIGAASGYYVRTRSAWSTYAEGRAKEKMPEPEQVLSSQPLADDPFRYPTTQTALVTNGG